MKASTVDIYNKEGDLTKIESYDGAGEHIADFLWDEHDAQTSENRVVFRKWVNHMLIQKGYEVPV